MKWKKLSDKFPDDWESKLIRKVGTNEIIDNNIWVHQNDRMECIFGGPFCKYNELEWLDESTEPNQEEELWDEMAHEMDREGIPVGEIESLMIYWKGQYTLSRK